MSQDPTTTATTSGSTRRQIITTGAFGAAAAAFLAACGTKNDAVAGQSGSDPTTTIAAPDAPLKDETEADLAYNTDLNRTATSLELLAVDLYDQYGPKLKDADWKANAARFSVDHQAAADDFLKATNPKHRFNKPNEYLQTHTIDPIADQLTNDPAILNMFAALESSLAATYIASVGSFTRTEGRSRFAGYAESAARRNAVLGNAGQGAPPTSALYPLEDLIPNEAYETVIKSTAND